MTSATTTAEAASPPTENVRVWPLAVATLALTWGADFLFWDATLGINLGIFAAVLGGVILAMRERTQIGRGAWLALGLLLGACVQSGIEVCFSNLCVLICLLLVLAGGTFFTGLAPGWRRWLRQGAAVLGCVERLPWLSATWLAQRGPNRAESPGGNIARMVMIVTPAAVLLVIFMAIFSSGNLVFNELLTRFSRRTVEWLSQLEWSQYRLLFWLLAASVILSLLRPRGGSAKEEPRTLGVWRRDDPRLAWMQSLSILVALNALFLMVNTIDVADLWAGQALPQGMDWKEYLHNGVNSLIVATVLAGVVLAGIFQQAPEVTRSRALRGLGYLWILQNLILAASVYRRDYLYVLVSQLLTEKRVYVLCFLGLVVSGYFFLAIHVRRGGTLAKLVWRNAVAAFVLFYAVQFFDVAGMVSRWCAAKTLSEKNWAFDVHYWSTQGQAAWPAVLQVANAPVGHPAREQAREYVERVRAEEKARPEQDWRGWQWLETRNRAAVLAEGQ